MHIVNLHSVTNDIKVTTSDYPHVIGRFLHTFTRLFNDMYWSSIKVRSVYRSKFNKLKKLNLLSELKTYVQLTYDVFVLI